MERASGILLPIFSLPGRYGIGSLGREARDFVDFLKEAGQKWWQVLPVGPVGSGNSPYASPSTFAGNPLYIDLDALGAEGLLTAAELAEAQVPSTDKVDYEALKATREPLLRKAFGRMSPEGLRAVEDFSAKNPWVREYALYCAARAYFGGAAWYDWPDQALRRHEPWVLAGWREKLAEDVAFHTCIQYWFFTQWAALKQYVNGLGIKIIGDIPIYVSLDSADVWAEREQFLLDSDGKPSQVAGVPPDYFSADGQLWGNPLYRWTSLRLHGYSWWVERMRAMAAMYDLIRIDHFIGFANYYSIPHGAPNARGGKWVVGPGKSLFRTFNRKLSGLPIIAEDLGCLSPRVQRLLDYVGYPGMKVLTFAFGGGDDNVHLPQNYPANCVAYTGTHDNDTVLGWLKSADEKSLAEAKETLGFEELEDGPEAFVRCAMESVSNDCVIPMQDILGLDTDARMNIPSTIGGNWLWRMKPGTITPALVERLQNLNRLSKRGV